MPERKRTRILCPDARDYGVYGQSPILFHDGFEVRVLASQDVREVPAVYCLHGWKYGNFEFLWMPYSLCNALAAFQQLMQNCLGELNLTYALIYLDDVIVFSQTEEDHLIQLWAVFERFREHGLKLKPSKCHFLWKEITFLGHRVSEEGMKPGDEGLKGITEMAPPQNYTEIRRFLSATRFFRHFIKNYACLLNDLLEGEASKWKTQPLELTLDTRSCEVFNILKTKCMTAPVLAFADFEKPFLLETDASSYSLRAVLSQKQEDDKYHPVAYVSQELKGGEKKYYSSKLEFLALKWAMTDQFKEYLWYKPFTVRTDNNLLTCVMTTPNLDAIGHQWVAAMAGYDMAIEYLKGADNKVTDMMSRVPQCLDLETVTVLLNHTRTSDVLRAEPDDPRVMEEHQKINEDVILCAHQLVKHDKRFWNLMNQDWVQTQMQDPVLHHVIEWIRRPRANASTLDEFMWARRIPEIDRRYYAQWQKDFVLKDNLLFLNITPSNSMETVSVFVVPARKRQAAIDGCHRSASHQGCDQTLSLMKERFWWPSMSRALIMAVSNCSHCKQFETKPQISGMQPIICTEPMELVHVDYVRMEVTVSTQEKPVVKNVLVVVDHFTRYVQAYVTRNKTVRMTAWVLYNEYFSVFSFPQRLMSDQGTGFMSKVITAMCSLLGIEKIRTTPYHPQSNGSAERVHQTLWRMIGKLDLEKCQKWPVNLGSVLIAYNATRSLVTGYSPYYLMFGRRPWLLIDLLFSTRWEHNLTCTIDEYVETLYQGLWKSVKIAQDSTLKEALWQKRLYDRKVGP